MNKKAEKILGATMKLFIENGAKKTTMDDIATFASVSKVTVYKYFVDKDTLILQVSQYIYSKYIDALSKVIQAEDTCLNKIYRCLDILTGFVNTGEFSLCMNMAKLNYCVDDEHRKYLAEYRRLLMLLIDEGKKTGLIYDDLDDDHIFYYIDMGVTYYQTNEEYRSRIRHNEEFRNQFMPFLIENIFIDKQIAIPPINIGPLEGYADLAKEGTKESIGKLMDRLNRKMTLADSKFIDFALSEVYTQEGIEVMQGYLFKGTQIQRNYCALYFGRLGEYEIVRKAYDQGLIDARQAFSR